MTNHKTYFKSISVFAISILLLMLWSGCVKDPTSIRKDTLPTTFLQGAFIVNEGSFSAANATLSFFNPDSGIVYNNVFSTANGEDLGSVGNSITIFNTLAFIVVNNSDKIEVISVNTFKRIAQITLPPGSSPRNLAILDTAKAYVSNLYTGSCSIIDLQSYQVTGTIQVGANPEGVVIANSKLYVANSGFGYGNTISVISTASDQVINTLQVGDNPISVAKDEQENVYILCTGSYGDWNDPTDDTPGSLWIINANDDSVVNSLIIEGHPGRLCLGSNNNGYFIGNGKIVEFDRQNATILNDSLIVAGINENYYGINYDPVTQQIFVLDAKDFFSQNGEVVIFDEAGTEEGRYEVGLIPGTVGFYYKQQ
jgi:YVTN family beta-propeller protein